MLRNAVFPLSSLAVLAAPAQAVLPDAPGPKPPAVFASDVVSTADAATLREALRLVDEGRIGALQRLRSDARDSALADLILWLEIRETGATARFDTLRIALDRLGDWPDTSRLRARAEAAIDGSSLSWTDRIAWLETSGPITGDGAALLAIGYHQAGKTDKAAVAFRDVWRERSITPGLARRILRDYGSYLTTDDHRARADFLVWTRQFTAARELRPYIGEDWRKLIDARMALAARARGVDDLVRAVPDALQTDPGLLFERARWRRRARLTDSVDELLLQIDGRQVPEAGRSRLWDEAHIRVRSAINRGDHDTAYRLASATGLTRGVDFAEAEFVSGWLALRKAGEPVRALQHFQRLEEGVTTPISLSRARYWRGRTYEGLAEQDTARTAFEAAAEFNFTFYGQLAAEETGEAEISFPVSEAITPERRTAFEARPQVRALRLLGEAGEARLFRTFALHIDESLESDWEHAALFDIAERYHMTHVGIRSAKSGLSRGIVAADAAYPLLGVRPIREARVEDALVMALSRQESELNPRAVSRADARGLMQLLPSTARRQAQLEGLPYKTSWLTDDPAYNVTLGSAHLDDLLDRFNGSYILTIAAYNAGASRSDQWMTRFGDPRTRGVDPVDWVESVPFSETRNYIQRVLENLQVYRHRLTGQPAPIRLSDDLRRGTPD